MDRLLVSWLVLGGILGAASSAVAQPTAPTGGAQPPAQAVEPVPAAGEAAAAAEAPATAEAGAATPPPAAAPGTLRAGSDAPASAPVEVPPPAPMWPSPPVPSPTAAAAAENVEAPVRAPEDQPEGTPLVVSGSFFGRYEVRDGYARMGVSRARWLEGDMTVYRARFGLATQPVEVTSGLTSKVVFVPQASGVFGTLSSTVADADLGLHEGYLRLGGSSATTFDLGRFEMDYGDALVIGNLGWHQTARSFDGARLHLQCQQDKPYLDAFVTAVEEGIALGDRRNGANDLYFAGVYAGLGPLVADGLALDVYELNQLRLRSNNVPLDLADASLGTGSRTTAVQATLGVRAKQKLGVVDYRFEADYQFGQRPGFGTQTTVSAYQVDGEVGGSIDDRFRGAVEGFYATGDDPATSTAEDYDQLYPTAHKWLGLADVIGARTNAAGVAGHLKVHPIAPWAVGLDVHAFFRPEHAPGSGAYAASEADLQSSYAFGKGLKASALYALFLPSDSAYPTDAAAHYSEVQLGYAF